VAGLEESGDAAALLSGVLSEVCSEPIGSEFVPELSLSAGVELQAAKLNTSSMLIKKAVSFFIFVISLFYSTIVVQIRIVCACT